MVVFRLSATSAAELAAAIPVIEMPAGHGGEADILADPLAQTGSRLITEAGNITCVTHPQIVVFLLHGEDELQFHTAPAVPVFAHRGYILPAGEGEGIILCPGDEDITPVHTQHPILGIGGFFVILVVQMTKA